MLFNSKLHGMVFTKKNKKLGGSLKQTKSKIDQNNGLKANKRHVFFLKEIEERLTEE